MNQIDPSMASPLVGAYIGLMALILVNIFIALLSAIFERVNDKADGYTGLQRAYEIVETEVLLSKTYNIKSFILKYLLCVNKNCTQYWRSDKFNPKKEDKRKEIELSIEERISNIENFMVICIFPIFNLLLNFAILYLRKRLIQP